MADIYKRQSVFAGTVADATAVTPTNSETLDILATPFIVRRVFVNVTTGITVLPTLVILNWRPVPGTGAFTELTRFTIPVAAADSQFEFNVEREDHSVTEVESAYDNPAGDQPPAASPYLIGEQRRDTAEGVTLVGPGGEFQILPGGEPSAGAFNVWVEVETRATAGELPNTSVQPI